MEVLEGLEVLVEPASLPFHSSSLLLFPFKVISGRVLKVMKEPTITQVIIMDLSLQVISRASRPTIMEVEEPEVEDSRQGTMLVWVEEEV